MSRMGGGRGEGDDSICVAFSTFKKSVHLKGHLWTHSKERPYQCDVCDERYTQKSHLTAHLRIHSSQLNMGSLV